MAETSSPTKKPAPSDLVMRAFDSEQQADIKKAIQEMAPEDAAQFVRLLERALRRRRVLLAGYILALVVLVLGLATSLYFIGRADEGEFVGWVFLVPIAIVGLILVGFGKLARKV